MTPPARQVFRGFGLVALTVPAVVAVGAIAFSFIPMLRDGVQPLALFMAAADGIRGVFIFTFLFGVPVTLLVTGLFYTVVLVRAERGRPTPGSTAVLVGGVAGGLVLPPLWLLGGASVTVVQLVGPAVLGAVAGAVGGALFWRVALRSSATSSAA